MMSAITEAKGRLFELPGNNIDTDRIIPARFLKCVEFEGLGVHVFEDDREALKGEHPFDKEENQGARILLAGEGFGSGSSREHAPVAIKDWGIQAIIALSYGTDIFHGNSILNDILCVTVTPAAHQEIREIVEGYDVVDCIVDVKDLTVGLRPVMPHGPGLLNLECSMPEGLRQKVLDGMTTFPCIELMLEARDLIDQLHSERPGRLVT